MSRKDVERKNILDKVIKATTKLSKIGIQSDELTAMTEILKKMKESKAEKREIEKIDPKYQNLTLNDNLSDLFKESLNSAAVCTVFLNFAINNNCNELVKNIIEKYDFDSKIIIKIFQTENKEMIECVKNNCRKPAFCDWLALKSIGNINADLLKSIDEAGFIDGTLFSETNFSNLTYFTVPGSIEYHCRKNPAAISFYIKHINMTNFAVIFGLIEKLDDEIFKYLKTVGDLEIVLNMPIIITRIATWSLDDKKQIYRLLLKCCFQIEQNLPKLKQDAKDISDKCKENIEKYLDGLISEAEKTEAKIGPNTLRGLIQENKMEYLAKCIKLISDEVIKKIFEVGYDNMVFSFMEETYSIYVNNSNIESIIYLIREKKIKSISCGLLSSIASNSEITLEPLTCLVQNGFRVLKKHIKAVKFNPTYEKFLEENYKK